MSYVIAHPEMMTSAASDLAAIASNVNAAHIMAAAPTTAVIPAAADEVSTSIAHLFSQHAASYQAMAGQAAAFNNQFVQHLTAGAGSYASAESTLASLLQDLQNLIWIVGGFVSSIPTTPPEDLFVEVLFLLFLLYLTATGQQITLFPLGF